jgi:hypothetical protein
LQAPQRRPRRSWTPPDGRPWNRQPGPARRPARLLDSGRHAAYRRPRPRTGPRPPAMTSRAAVAPWQSRRSIEAARRTRAAPTSCPRVPSWGLTGQRSSAPGPELVSRAPGAARRGRPGGLRASDRPPSAPMTGGTRGALDRRTSLVPHRDPLEYVSVESASRRPGEQAESGFHHDSTAHS